MAAPIVNEEYKTEMKSARGELEHAISKKEKSSCHPIIMLRLAYACQFSIASAANAAKTKTTDGTSSKPKREGKENKQVANTTDLQKAIDICAEAKTTDGTPSKPKREGKENNQVAITDDLQKAIGICANIKANHPTITYPDLYQLAGVVAVEKLGGPTIEFLPGRKDSSIPPDEGCLPDGNQGPSDLRKAFSPMGLSDKDIVALCGGLKLARAHSEGSGVERQTKGTLKFDNSYFVELLKTDTDKALVEDLEFRKYVGSYEKNKDAFFTDYAEAHKKFSEYKPPSEINVDIHEKNEDAEAHEKSSEKPLSSVLKNIPQRVVGVAVAAAVVILSFFYLIRRRRRASKQHSSQQIE